ncbi:MAG: hypothetical protein ACK58N_15110 [Synechocystis sp.]|jgi:hypothetical protein
MIKNCNGRSPDLPSRLGHQENLLADGNLRWGIGYIWDKASPMDRYAPQRQSQSLFNPGDKQTG